MILGPAISRIVRSLPRRRSSIVEHLRRSFSPHHCKGRTSPGFSYILNVCVQLRLAIIESRGGRAAGRRALRSLAVCCNASLGVTLANQLIVIFDGFNIQTVVWVVVKAIAVK